MDPIADMLAQLKNAAAIKKPLVTVPFSEHKSAIAETLKRAGYLKSVTKKGKKIKKTLELELVYLDGQARLTAGQRVSKPSRRVYQGATAVHAVRQGHGTAIYSTTGGIMTDKEARAAKLGGELLFKVW